MSLSDGLRRHDDGVIRCVWCTDDTIYRAYHDDEWGMPVVDETRLFEKLCLEGFQSGLSWLTILRKRENFRRAFAGFDARAVAGFGEREVKRLLADAGIIRHRGKIESTINNAKRMLEHFPNEGQFAAFVWSFETEARTRERTWAEMKATTTNDNAKRFSKELKTMGFSFVGPTTAYAFMQAMGLVDDHVKGCPAGDVALKARKRLKRPGLP